MTKVVGSFEVIPLFSIENQFSVPRSCFEEWVILKLENSSIFLSILILKSWDLKIGSNNGEFRRITIQVKSILLYLLKDTLI